ncbi:conserved hypothetical protein [Hyphomicrobiales bacterium]|nr:conserved hypothetical protein [Hyphomicrobiales bacterium]CAH1664080.1 conserved hypothetical protein [Hyphomicrobiales bacterium]
MENDDEPRRFKVIQGGPAQDGKAEPKRYRARKRGDIEPLVCTTCERDVGVATAISMDVKLGRMIQDGRPVGGTKAIICVTCLSRGKVTILAS